MAASEPRSAASSNEVEPHRFRPLRLRDAFYGGGRCRHCRVPMSAHPIHCYVAARPLGDKSRAELTWEALSGR